jgi:putative membrane protein insertion efficiency factor
VARDCARLVEAEINIEDGGLKPAATHACTSIEELEERAILKEQSIPVRAALSALRFYKAYLSMLFAGTCRFEPTCSRYAYEAIERFGVAKGIWLGTKRLLRCQPLSRKFGFDPVPEKWEIMSSEMNAVETSASRAAATQNEVHS